LRIGYALAGEPIIDALRRANPPWSTSAPAIAGGLAALAVKDKLSGSIAMLRRERELLAARLCEQGWTVLPSVTHFLLVATANATVLRTRLLHEHHIQVRDCTSFGLPQFVRIAARTPADNERLRRAMEVMR
jgi:histidinol-phosphate/aromatic aminotransferase/cobyric acid decarboxylase-like protein